MESILISISMILKILWTVFCKIIIWNKNIKLIFFTTYSTVEFYFWKRNEIFEKERGKGRQLTNISSSNLKEDGSMSKAAKKNQRIYQVS